MSRKVQNILKYITGIHVAMWIPNAINVYVYVAIKIQVKDNLYFDFHLKTVNLVFQPPHFNLRYNYSISSSHISLCYSYSCLWLISTPVCHHSKHATVQSVPCCLMAVICKIKPAYSKKL